jgi:hypothetical protein
VLTQWRAPFTGGHVARIPGGTRLLADIDQGSDAPGFYLVPERYEELGLLLVPGSDRTSAKYDGYALSFLLDDIGPKLKELS